MKRITLFTILEIFFVLFFSKITLSVTFEVSMRDSFFQPQTATINVGDTVRWTNEGFLLHTTTSGTGCTSDGKWDSGSMSNGQSFSLTFNQPGSYPYFCSFHCFSGMIGTIIVNPNTISVPAGPQVFPPYLAIESPVLSIDPAQAKPIGVGSVATGGDSLNIEIGLNQLTDNVDIYLAVLSPSLNPEIHVLTSNGTFQPLSAGLVPWISNTTGPLNIILLQNFPISALPQGTYTFFLALTPSGDISRFYLWTTSFTVSFPLDNPILDVIEKSNISVKLVTVAMGLTAPNWGTFAPGDSSRLFVIDQDGIVWAIDLATGNKMVFLDVSNKLIQLGISGPDSYDERGLLGIAFDPNYVNNGLLYTYTSEPAGTAADFPLPLGITVNHQSVVTEWKVSNPGDSTSVVDSTSARVLLRIDQPQFNHNGGAINFGPDGFLYISLGDGGSADDQGAGHSVQGNGQDTSNVLGTILRIDPHGSNSPNGQYGIPQDNPFVPEGVSTLGGQSGCNDGFCDEIFAYGFRNPFRFSFDMLSGDLYVADVGQNHIEEVDVVVSGANYGWPIREGSFCFDPNGESPGFASGVSVCGPSDLVDPIAEYDHDEGIAIVGGFIYRGSIIPEFQGTYVFGDFSRNFLNNDGRLFFLNGEKKISELSLVGQASLGLSLLGFGQDASGELYVLGNTAGVPFGDTGVVLKIVPQ